MNRNLCARSALTLASMLLALFASCARAQNSSPPASASAQRAACLSYEPASVELRGTIIQRTYPGPPNYESVERGDAPEVYWLLVLPRPACVEAGKDDPDNYPAEKDIRELQLVFMDPDAYKTYKDLLGKKVVAKGTLFPASTGHHKTPVLLTVDTLAKAH